jgi:membrane protein DedA with SNARE-associated domain
MEYGALAGSAILPGAGTIIGTIAGAMLGSRFGQAAGYHAGKFIVTKPMSWAGQQKDMAATENDSVSFNQ